MEPSEFNREAWDRIGNAGDRWFFGATPEEIAKAKTGDWNIKITPTKNVPRSWMTPIESVDLLLLAGGGGQQAPVLAAAGAKVTVVDVSEGQLARDVAIAKREGLSINTLQADIANLEMVADETFDLIINPTSVCYCESLQPIWNEAFRVLRPGGRLIAGFMNPVNYLFDAIKRDRDDLVVRHAIGPGKPYRDSELPQEEIELLISPERPFEFGHSLTDLIGGQIAAGFQICGYYTDRWGGHDSLSDFIDVFSATSAVKSA